MYGDFREFLDVWFPPQLVAPTRRVSIDDVPDFLWHAPENEDGSLDSIAMLGEN